MRAERLEAVAQLVLDAQQPLGVGRARRGSRWSRPRAAPRRPSAGGGAGGRLRSPVQGRPAPVGSARCPGPPTPASTSTSGAAACSCWARSCSRGYAYDELSMATIAREAGISKALLYHYFPGKQAYFAATLEEKAAELAALTEPDPSLPPLEQLTRSLDAFLDWVGGQPRGLRQARAQRRRDPRGARGRRPRPRRDLRADPRPGSRRERRRPRCAPPCARGCGSWTARSSTGSSTATSPASSCSGLLLGTLLGAVSAAGEPGALTGR